MKITFALISLLPLLGAAASIENRSPMDEVTELPELDTSAIPEELFALSGIEGENEGEVSAEACPRSAPYLCLGRCCPYNICCRNSCCNPTTDYCGRYNGHCYRYT